MLQTSALLGEQIFWIFAGYLLGEQIFLSWIVSQNELQIIVLELTFCFHIQRFH